MKDKLEIPRYPNQDSIGAGTDTSHMEYWGDKGATTCANGDCPATQVKDGYCAPHWYVWHHSKVPFNTIRSNNE